MTRLLVVRIVVAAGMAAAFTLSLGAQAQPDPSGAALIQSRCLACHGDDLIASQRLSERGWEGEIAKMVRWGAAVSAEERPGLVSYLARQFGPTPLASHDAAPSSGQRTYETACRSCHGDDLVDQQRLSAAGWSREVDKMIGWGAPVAVSDKAALVAYLVGRQRR
ncbi:MAG: c-type cytochrome [Vicinamibacterales bacterium]